MGSVKQPKDESPTLGAADNRGKSASALRGDAFGDLPTVDLSAENPTEVLDAGQSSVYAKALPQQAALVAEAVQPNVIGTVIAGRYRLDRELGRGGMGLVFLSHHLSLDIPVAVKVMLPKVASDPLLVRRFQREARATSTLKHRNIVKVFDFGVHEGVPFLVMEFLDGVPLSQRLFERGGWLPIAEVDAVMQGLLSAFEAAHQLGIIHRDLKPDNIYLAGGEGDEVVKVLDFGLAHMKDPTDEGPTLTRADMVSGTPEYMSPEQCRSLKVGASTDLYAIGCVLTEMLQGQPPFEGASSVDVMTKQMFYEAPAINPPPGADAVPVLVERLRLDMLAKRPANRPADIEALRRRWNEAVDPAAAAAIPTRKIAEPAGTREQRAPEWSDAAPVSAPSATGSQPSGAIGLYRLTKDERGVDESCIMGLHAQEMAIKPVADSATAEAFSVVVLDVAGDVDGACDWLGEVPEANREGVLVCVDNPSAADMTRLIEAGAGGVLGYPVSPVSLRKKVKRLLRKVARNTST